MDIQIFNTNTSGTGQINKGRARQKRGSFGKNGKVGFGSQKSQPRASQIKKGSEEEDCFTGLGKRCLEKGDVDVVTGPDGKRVFLRDVTNSRVEVANPKGPPTRQ